MTDLPEPADTLEELLAELEAAGAERASVDFIRDRNNITTLWQLRVAFPPSLACPAGRKLGQTQVLDSRMLRDHPDQRRYAFSRFVQQCRKTVAAHR